jgi:phage terminase large subunit-like protein
MISNPRTEQVERMRRYIDQVAEERIAVGRAERLAVLRYLDDLENAPARGWHFSEELASRALAFFPTLLQHPVGRWAGDPFVLLGWQSFLTWQLFGWIDPATELRRFRSLYISVGRKNGKSSYLGGLLCKLLFDDVPATDHAGEIYCAGPKLEQAQIVYRTACLMIEQNDWLRRRCKISSKKLFYDETKTRMQAVGMGPMHGFNPSVVCLDETHEYVEHMRNQFDALTTGGAARVAPLLVQATTAGEHQVSVIWEEQDAYATQVLEAVNSGHIVDDSLLAFICRYDRHDNALEPELFRKGNPSLGETVSEEYLEAQRNEASKRPSSLVKWQRFHCNRPVSSQVRAFPELDDYDACADHDLDLDDYVDSRAFAGMDLARSYDFAGFALCIPCDDGRKLLQGWSWVARDGQFDVTIEPFASWIAEGWLRICEGSALNYAQIEDEICEILEQFDVVSLAFDRAWAREMAGRLNERTGVELYEFPQVPQRYNEACCHLTDRLPKREFLHDGNPCNRWQLENLHWRPNADELIMPAKGKNTDRKVDVWVAKLMALGEFLYHNEDRRTYYEDNGVELI